MARKTEAGEAPKGKDLTLDEVGDPGPVEKVAETEFAKAAELEAFMNEPVEIRIAQSTEQGALPVIVPSVNGVNQPLIRGKRQVVKRKYVEALARCRLTTYVQETPNPQKPENIQMREQTALVYPFEILKDTDKGHAWVQSLLAQP